MRISDWSSDVCSSDLDQRDAAADGAQLGDQRLVARAVEDADDDVARRAALLARDRLDILAHALVEIDDVGRIAWADRQLVHIDVGGVEQASLLGDRETRERVGAGLGGDRRSLERVEPSVDIRALTGGATALP